MSKLQLSFKVLQKSFLNLKNRIENIDDVKLIILQKKIDDLDKEINNIIIDYDKNNTNNLTEEDIERIEIDEEANKLFKKFLPYMLMYSLSEKNT